MPTSHHLRKRLLLLAATTALIVTATAVAQTNPTHDRIIGYATSWNPVQTKDINKIDTLIFAFAKLIDGKVVLDDAGKQKLQQLIALKKINHNLKVEISVGGWAAGGFSEAASSASSRQAFADSAAALIAAQAADGLDVDWEYPGHHESGIHDSPQDRENFTALLKTIRRSLDRSGLTQHRSAADHYSLSIAVGDGPFVSGIDIAAVAPYLDWFNLMTYDFVNSLTPTTGHHTGLHASATTPADARTTDRAVAQFLAAGVPAHKLVIGAAFYGRDFADVNPEHQGLYQRYGHYQGEEKWPALKSDYINKNGFVRYWDAVAQAPWLWNEKTRRFISFDDPQSIAAKAAYVKANHIGGIMYWEQSLDPSDELLDDMWRELH